MKSGTWFSDCVAGATPLTAVTAPVVALVVVASVPVSPA